MRTRTVRLLLAALLVTGCARAMDVGSDPRPTYSIAVENTLREAMIVSYTDDRGQALLGTVQPGRTEYFVIAAPASASITVSGRNTSGSVTSGPWPVGLIVGERPTIRLR